MYIEIDNSTGRDRSRGACRATINTAAMGESRNKPPPGTVQDQAY